MQYFGKSIANVQGKYYILLILTTSALFLPLALVDAIRDVRARECELAVFLSGPAMRCLSERNC